MLAAGSEKILARDQGRRWNMESEKLTTDNRLKKNLSLRSLPFGPELMAEWRAQR
jgi:hypothetical protein